MLRFILAFPLLALAGGFAAGYYEPAGVKAGPPQLTRARLDRDGFVVLTVAEPAGSVTTYQIVTGTIQVAEGRRTVTYYAPVTTTRWVETEKRFEPRSLQVFDAAGDPVTVKAFLTRLVKQEVAVVVSPSGQMIDPIYRAALKKGTFVLLLPGSSTPVPPPPPATEERPPAPVPPPSPPPPSPTATY